MAELPDKIETVSTVGSRAEAACAELRLSALARNIALPPDTLCEDLHAAVERAADISTDAINQLRRAVEQFTIALRSSGARPEAVLIALKSVINSRTFPVHNSYEGEGRSDNLRQQISTWSIQEFFREIAV